MFGTLFVQNVCSINPFFVILYRRKLNDMKSKKNITPKYPWHVYNERALHLVSFMRRQRAASVSFIGGHPDGRMD